MPSLRSPFNIAGRNNQAIKGSFRKGPLSPGSQFRSTNSSGMYPGATNATTDGGAFGFNSYLQAPPTVEGSLLNSNFTAVIGSTPLRNHQGHLNI